MISANVASGKVTLKIVDAGLGVSHSVTLHVTPGSHSVVEHCSISKDKHPFLASKTITQLWHENCASAVFLDRQLCLKKSKCYMLYIIVLFALGIPQTSDALSAILVHSSKDKWLPLLLASDWRKQVENLREKVPEFAEWETQNKLKLGSF